MLVGSGGLPRNMWAETWSTATYLQNQSLTKAVMDMTLYKANKELLLLVNKENYLTCATFF